jgi:hypothetical protein
MRLTTFLSNGKKLQPLMHLLYFTIAVTVVLLAPDKFCWTKVAQILLMSVCQVWGYGLAAMQLCS